MRGFFPLKTAGVNTTDQRQKDRLFCGLRRGYTLKIGLTEISRSRFKQYKNPILITQINVLGCFVNFLVVFRCIWKEIVFLKRVVKFGEIRNS